MCSCAHVLVRSVWPQEAIALITPILPLLLEHCPLSVTRQSTCLPREYFTLSPSDHPMDHTMGHPMDHTMGHTVKLIERIA